MLPDKTKYCAYSLQPSYQYAVVIDRFCRCSILTCISDEDFLETGLLSILSSYVPAFDVLETFSDHSDLILIQLFACTLYFPLGQIQV